MRTRVKGKVGNHPPAVLNEVPREVQNAVSEAPRAPRVPVVDLLVVDLPVAAHRDRVAQLIEAQPAEAVHSADAEQAALVEAARPVGALPKMHGDRRNQPVRQEVPRSVVAHSVVPHSEIALVALHVAVVLKAHADRLNPQEKAPHNESGQLPAPHERPVLKNGKPNVRLVKHRTKLETTASNPNKAERRTDELTKETEQPNRKRD